MQADLSRCPSQLSFLHCKLQLASRSLFGDHFVCLVASFTCLSKNWRVAAYLSNFLISFWPKHQHSVSRIISGRFWCTFTIHWAHWALLKGLAVHTWNTWNTGRTLKTGQKQILCLCPALEGIPSCSTSVIIDIFPVAPLLLGRAVSGGVGVVADVVPVMYLLIWFKKRRRYRVFFLTGTPPLKILSTKKLI